MRCKEPRLITLYMKRLRKWIGILLAVVVCTAAAVTVIFMILHSKSNGCRIKKETLQLPVIHINTDDVIPWEGKTPCVVSVVTNNDSTIWNGKVKYRGGISIKYAKHSYSLKLNEPHVLCGLPESKTWIINANYIDKTFMRHKLCYDLFRQMGPYNLAPLCAYALVRENGNPQGLYVVMQRLNEHTLHLNEDDSAAVIFKEPKIFYPDSIIAKRKHSGENYQGQTYPDFDMENRNNLMEEMRYFLVSTPDSIFYAKVGQTFDLQNLIDWHLLLLLINGGDNVLKNFYLYRQDSQTPYRVAIWDCDHSFGRDCDNEKNMLKQLLEDDRNILLNRMMQSKKYQKALKKRYHELRKNGIFSYRNIKRMMQENDPWVRLGLEENTRLWPFDSDNYYDAAGYDEEYALILEFVTLNLQRLDGVFGFTESH